MSGASFRARTFAAERARRGGRCQWPAGCETHDGLEFAHIRPTGLSGMGRGSWERARDVLDHPDAYLLLCRPHHAEHDGFKRGRA